MTITKVKYEKLFPTGAYLNEKIGFEAEIGTRPITQGEDAKKLFDECGVFPVKLESPLEVVEMLRQLCEQSHKEKYPHLYTESGSPITIVQIPEDEKPTDPVQAH